MLRILIRNIVSNWVGFAVQVVVVFFLTPFIVHTLGDARYGVWALVTSLTGYYGLLDLGFRSGITQYLARHLATGNFDELNRTASTAFVALACCGVVVGLASLGMAWIAPSIFTIPPDTIVEAQGCILIIGLGTALQFTFFLYSSVFTATQRYDLANVVGIAIRLAAAAATVVALREGYGLVGLVSVNAVGELLGCFGRWRISARILPQMRVSPGLAAWSNLRSIANFGLWTFLIGNANVCKACAGGFIIGIFMPISALAPYSLAMGLITYFSSFFLQMAIVFFPAATQLDARGDVQRLKRMFFAGSKLIILLATIATLTGVLWAADFYRLWVGERFVDGKEYPSVALLFSLLVCATFISIAQAIGKQVLLGRRRLKELAALTLGEAVTSVALCVVLVRQFGLVGVTLGVLTSAIVFQGLLQPIVVCRVLHVSAKEYLSSIWLRPLLFGAVLFVVLGALHRAGPSEYHWMTLSLAGVVAGVSSLPFLIVMGLDASERNRLIVRPVRLLLARFPRGSAVIPTEKET